MPSSQRDTVAALAAITTAAIVVVHATVAVTVRARRARRSGSESS